MQAEFLSTSDHRWRDLLRRGPHDFYHLPEYVALSAAFEGGDPIAFYAEDGDAALLIPLLLKKIPDQLGIEGAWWDVVSPTGYASPLLLAEEAAAAGRLNQFMRVFFSMGQALGLVSVFLQLHPLLTLPRSGWDSFGQLVHHGRTVTIDLLPAPRAVPRTKSGAPRQPDWSLHMEAWQEFEDFLQQYHVSLPRLRPSRRYLFSPRYVAALRETLGDRLHPAILRSAAGETVAAALFVAYQGVLGCLLAATTCNPPPQGSMSLLFDQVGSWARQRGERVVLLGAGSAALGDWPLLPDPGKSRQAAEILAFRGVFDPEKYARLSRAWRKGGEGNSKVPGDYFPAYHRAPRLG